MLSQNRPSSAVYTIIKHEQPGKNKKGAGILPSPPKARNIKKSGKSNSWKMKNTSYNEKANRPGKARDKSQAKEKHRYRLGERAIRDTFQRCVKAAITDVPFHRLIRELVNDRVRMKVGGENYLGQPTAFQAVKEARESLLVHLMSDSNLCAFHARRVTSMVNGFQLGRAIRGH